MKKVGLVILLILGSLVSCNDKYPDLDDGIYAEIITDKGIMVAELYAEDAPATVANFVALAEGNHPIADSIYTGKPFYNGLTFHRILKDFMIQGGDPQGNGRGNAGHRFHDEFSENRKHDALGILSMANGGPSTNSSQFFITHKPTPWLDGRHTVWGKVRIGYEVIDEIAGVEMKYPDVAPQDPKAGIPADSLFIKEVNIIRKGGTAKAFNAPKVFEEQLAEEEKKKEEAEKARQALLEPIRAHYEAQKADVETLESGLQIHWQNKGDGEKPKLGDKVLVDYAVYFTSGELLDTSMQSAAEAGGKFDQARAQANAYVPYPMDYSPDAQLIAGVKEGLQLMRVGDKATLFIPYHLAYGERGRPGGVPPRADLIFEMEVKGIANK